jgi:putative hydrolase of the HAD superfamily
MIKNIVFDLGNVLISFKPSDYLDKMGYAAEIKNIIITDIFKSREWEEIDNGSITTPEAIEKISERSSLTKEEITAVFRLRIKILSPIFKNVQLLPLLKSRGYRLYYLSNFPSDIFDEVFNKFELFQFFDGGIISSKVNFSKPDLRIYKFLLEKYSLVADECLFFDDSEINIKGAESVGIKSILVFESADLSELIEKELWQFS